MTPGLLWILAGLAASGVEMLLPMGGYLLWVGLAAVGAGVLTEWAGFGFAGQVAAFIVLVAALLALPLLRRRRTPPLVNIPDDDMLGRTCRAIAFRGAEGRVSLGDGSWSARLAAGVEPAPDALLLVVGREGTTLLVTRTSE